MTISFSEVRPGDRILLGNATGTLGGVVVEHHNGGLYVDMGPSECVYTWPENWDTLEILEPPLPTEPGYYVRADEHLDREAELFLFIGDAEGWSSDSEGDWHFIPVEEVPRNLVRLVKETR